MKWGLNLFVTVFATMVCIYIIKKAANKFNIPFVKDVAAEV